MKLPLTIVQIILGIALTALILLQAKGTGLGRTFGSTSFHSKRGLEKITFRFTVALSILFVIASITVQFVP